MKTPSAFTVGLDVLALGIVALFTFTTAASLAYVHTWTYAAISMALLATGLYLTGRAALNLKARLSAGA